MVKPNCPTKASEAQTEGGCFLFMFYGGRDLSDLIPTGNAARSRLVLRTHPVGNVVSGPYPSLPSCSFRLACAYGF